MAYSFVYNSITGLLDMVGISSSVASGFFILAGQAGGQIGYGGTNSGDNLTLFPNTSGNGFINFGNNSVYDELNTRFGLNTNTPTQTLTVSGLLLCEGTFGSGEILTVTGAGARMFFYPKKGAFRAGVAAGTEFNDANIGTYSVAMGNGPIASGQSATSIGAGSSAIGTGSIAIGASNIAKSFEDVCIGSSNSTQGVGSNVLIGAINQITGAGDGGSNSIFGFDNTTLSTGGQAIIFGSSNINTSDFGILFGFGNTLTQPSGGVNIGMLLLGMGLSWDTDGYIIIGSNANTIFISDTSINTGGFVGIGLSTVAQLTDQLTVAGNIKTLSTYKSSDGSSGISTTITTSSLAGKTITVKDGIITGFA